MSIKLSRDLKYLAGVERDLRTVTEKVVKKAGKVSPTIKRIINDISSVREALEMAIIFFRSGQVGVAGNSLKEAIEELQKVERIKIP